MEQFPIEFVPASRTHYYLDPFAATHVVHPRQVPQLGSSYNLYGFTKTSDFHGRSMSDPEGHLVRQEPLRDKHGDIYTAFSIKGADGSDPRLTYTDVDVNNLRANGLLDTSVFERARQMSEHLREQGVLTEWVMYQAMPRYYLGDQPGEKLSPLERNGQIYDASVRWESTLGVDNMRAHGVGLPRLAELGKALIETRFGVMYRAMLSNVRLVEARQLEGVGVYPGSGDLDRYVKEAIESLQTREPTHFGVWKDIKDLQAESAVDQARYLQETLPSIMGENLARLHGAGCLHHFPHVGNWTLAGELVDLDSVSYEKNPADKEDITDLGRFSEVKHAAIWAAVCLGDLFVEKVAKEEDGKILLIRHNIFKQFNDAYFAERVLHDGLSQLEQVFLHTEVCPPKHHDELSSRSLIVNLEDSEIQTALREASMHALEAGLYQKPDYDLMEVFGTHLRKVIVQKVTDFLAVHGVELPSRLFSLEPIVTHEFAAIMIQVGEIIDKLQSDERTAIQKAL